MIEGTLQEEMNPAPMMLFGQRRGIHFINRKHERKEIERRDNYDQELCKPEVRRQVAPESNPWTQVQVPHCDGSASHKEVPRAPLAGMNPILISKRSVKPITIRNWDLR